PVDNAEVTKLEKARQIVEQESRNTLDTFFENTASKRSRERGGEREDHEKALRQHYEKSGIAGFEGLDSGFLGMSAPARAGSLTKLAALFVMGWWFLMLAFQGEGLELDFQRRRHPMWEWLMSHSVPPTAVFLAEMLSPLAANIFFIGAPAFWIGLHWMLYGDFLASLVTGLLAGVPVALAACCASKALEIATMLRLSPRTRGAVLGIMSWLGYSAFILGIISLNARPTIFALVGWMAPVSHWVSWSLSDWVLGYGMGQPSAWKAVAVCWGLSAVVIFIAVQFSARATNQGLAGGFGSTVSAPAALSAAASRRWLRDPLYRKELLWFWRDRGALVQVFLIPMTLAAQQSFNLRGLASIASRSWHTLAGAAVIFGTYFLFILGPRSLISEGQALWLPQTWPRGMEALLKAKARLWWFIACIVVLVILAVDALMFPRDLWRIALIAVGWLLFSGSLAEKSVTLVTVPSSSGEPEPVPFSRRMAASLGTFTFAAGVISQQWSLAFVGIVYSWLTSAAMWQNFRARLPFLFDPWSEKLPPPPTLMHAMIAISAMMEGMAVVLVAMLALLGRGEIVTAQSIAYGVAGFTTLLIVGSWMNTRGVRSADIWKWPGNGGWETRPVLEKLFAGLVMGVLMGIVALGYLWLVQHIPVLQQLLSGTHSKPFPPGHRIWLLIMAVGMAPIAEEYLFRGLLFRALDREWGGWRALVASSLFFAIYHPPVAWLPVAALGFLNSFLFRRTGHLAPCVVAHMAYNMVVVSAM
ncbi:MAG: family intrarane metalloprotease, partial [Verrucomicrobiaceae bacterium]|nr:family intrarane metalloprotease [Verrucomicrobiaceae bacterium]